MSQVADMSCTATPRTSLRSHCFCLAHAMKSPSSMRNEATMRSSQKINSTRAARRPILLTAVPLYIFIRSTPATTPTETGRPTMSHVRAAHAGERSRERGVTSAPVAAKTTMKITAAQLRATLARIVAFANLASPPTLHLHGRPASRAAAAHEGWSGRRDLNPRPCGPKPHALARLRYAPIHLAQAVATPRPARQAATRCRGVAPAYIGFDILYSACTSAFQALRHPTCPTRRHPTLTTGG